MGENTAISWTDHTWNPWVGCHKVSQGCKNCYMFREQTHYGADPNIVRRTAPATFNAPLKWKEPARVFTCSWSDFFIEEADYWRNEAVKIIEETPHLTYQILTKRTDRLYEQMRWPWPYNTWLGTSVESEEHYFRVHQLTRTNVGNLPRKLFVSCEPLLGPLDLTKFLRDRCGYYCDEAVGHVDHNYKIDWVIVGGESGPSARPMNLDWARSIRDQCAEHEIPFFFKQVGGNKKIDGTWGGDLLDGKQYHEFPETTPSGQIEVFAEAKE